MGRDRPHRRMAVSPSALGKVVEVFERNFRDRGELGASVSIWWDGAELLSHGHGWCEREQKREWTKRDAGAGVFGHEGAGGGDFVAGAGEPRLERGNPGARGLAAFSGGGARFFHLLSHQCGLAALDRRASVLEHAAVVEAIEAQVPAWRLGDGHGYHPRTFGALVDEPVRRLTGLTLGGYWREMIAGPLDLDFWIGLPETEWPRVARLYPGKAGKDDLADAFYKQLTTSGTFTRRAFSSPRGLHAIHEMNEPRAWSAGLPALGGVGTASALAKFYQAAIGSIESPLPVRVRQALATPRSSGEDRVLLRPTVFTCGAQQDPLDAEGRKLRIIYGPSISAFGHPGAGGSHGLGDPETGISFAYVMNQMDLSVMPGVKCVEMVDALFSEL